MGIYGLATFVQEHSSLGEQKIWPVDATEKSTCFIIDGNAFTYHYAMQSRTSWAHGGQYAAVARIIQQSVLSLQRAGIELTFVFDGAVPQDKQKTRLHRYTTYIERGLMTLSNLDNINASLRQSTSSEPQIPNDLFLLPPLMLDVCIQALCEVGIKPIICIGEADDRVVSIANELDGYVVSKDSDMHVYPHSGQGYISLNTLSIKNDIVSAKVYRPSTLAALLGLDVALLPLFGTLLGNDYLDVKLVRMPIIEWCSERGFQCKNKTVYWPKFVAEFLRKIIGEEKCDLGTIMNKVLKQLDTIVKGGIDASVIVDSVRRYDSQSMLLNPDDRRRNDEADYAMEHLSRPMTDILVTRTFWSPIFLEDFQQPSSWLISRPLRRHLYHLLSSTRKGSPTGGSHDCDSPEVLEYIREKHHLKAIRVTTAATPAISLQPQPQPQPQPQQRSGFMQLAGFHHSAGVDLSDLSHEYLPLVLCVRYLIYESKYPSNEDDDPTANRLKDHEVVGLLIGGLASRKNQADQMNIKPTIKKRALHLTAQFEGIVFCSHLLGQALGIPYLDQKGALASIYDGLQVHHYLQLARRGASIGRMLGEWADKRLFWRLYHIVMAGLDDAVENVYDFGIPDSWTQEDEPACEWLNPAANAKKRIGTSQTPSKVVKRKQARSAPVKRTGGANVFDVLSFGCSFDE